MYLDLRLNDLPKPRVAAIRLEGPTRILQTITNRNLVEATQGVESRQFQNRKEKLKQRLVERGEHVTFEQATDKVGRRSMLLSLYLQYATDTDAPWLPAFDEVIAHSVLGANGREWHAGERNKAT